MRFTRLSAALFGALALATPALSQDVADPVDPLEDQALQQEAQARFEEALDTFQKAFEMSVRQAGTSEANRAGNLARAEVLLEKIDSLTETVTRHGETAKHLEGFSSDDLGPVLKANVDWFRARYMAAEGDLEGAERIADGLGLIRNWWVIGPFDNERGRGFGVGQPPEKVIDLAAEYEGKERPVSWRQVPVRETLGFVNLNALLRPNNQALAYAAAFVRSDREQGAAVRIGSDEAIKARWNGTEVLARNIRRQIAFDQDVVGVTLSEGWNVLLLKVHDQTGAWGFRARLTAPDGSALTGVTVASTPEQAQEAAEAAKKLKAKTFDGSVSGGAKSYYEELTGGDMAGSPRQLFHLGLLHHRRGFDNVTDRRAENLLKRAAELDPENGIYRFHYAEAAAPPTEMAVEKEENRQRAGREKALELAPGYAVAYRALADYYTNSLLNLERAESLLRKALEINPDFLEARLDLATVLGRRGLTAAAQVEREKAIGDAKFKGREAWARAYANELQRQGRGREALMAWKEVIGLDGRSNGVRTRVAKLASEALDREGALAVLTEIAKVDPYNTSSLRRLAELHEGAGDWDAASAVLSRALTIAPEDDRLLTALGRVQLKAGDQEGALATYREALRVNPKLQKIERYVEFLDPSAVPYENDYFVDVAPLIEGAKDYDNAENDGWVVLLDHIINKVNPDGTSSTYTHMAAKILTDAGVKRFDRFPAQVWGNQAFKWKLTRVHKPDGSIVDAKTQSFGNFRLVDFPPLTPGDVVEVEYRADERQQSFFGDYFGTVNYFADQVPLLLSTFTLITPAEREFYFNAKRLDVEPTVELKGEEDEERQRVYTWTVENSPKVRSEPGMPGPRETYPQLEVSTYESWDAFATWWWSMIRDQHIASDSIKEKVAEVTAEKETRWDKIRAIYEFVTNDVTYQAWEFGVHGYKPYTTTAIFEKKEGDCKDKAILMNTMFREIGVEAYPVLIRGEEPRSEEDFSLAMVNHFNHCISYIPDVDGEGTPLFLDGTVQYGSMMPPSMDRGAKVLIVKPDGAEITEVPLGTPDDQGIDQTWTVTVNDDGSAVAKGEIVCRGDIALQIRRVFSVPGQRPMILQGMLARSFGRLKLLSHDFDDLKDFGEPQESFRIEAEIASFAKKSGDHFELPTAFVEFMGDLSGLVSRAEREHDLMLMNPISMRTEATYELPAGWSVTTPPEDLEMTTEHAAFSTKATHEGSTLRLSRNIEVRAPRVPKDAYPEFRDGYTKAMAVSKQTWKVAATESNGGDE